MSDARMEDHVVPDSFMVCGRCGEFFEHGGGKITAETFDGSTPEVGSPRLCRTCYETIAEKLIGLLFFGETS